MIKLFVFDFDGVITDGRIYFNTNGEIIKHYNVKDGSALKKLKHKNIKLGCISGYKKNKSQELILNHLNVVLTAFSCKNKLFQLIKWCEELKIDISNEVAYIGDDINDLECLKNVKFSGCPSDAVKECKQICNFISDFKGGHGCIKDFCDYILNFKELCDTKKLINNIKKEFNNNIDCFNKEEINNLIKCINNHKYIYTTGIGKSGNIAKHFSDMLKSISVSTSFLHPINSIHGDLGTIKNNDLIILFSNSGNTQELLELLPLIKGRATTICICSNKKSKLSNLSDYTVLIPEVKELNYNIPTNSIMMTIILCNIIISLLSKNISIDNYKLNHPAGNIGKKLKQVKDVLITDIPILILESNININSILLEMTNYKLGCCFFIDKEKCLKGILTDGDIRRLLLKNNNLKTISLKDINTNFYFETNLYKYIKDFDITGYIPILNNKNIIGMVKI